MTTNLRNLAALALTATTTLAFAQTPRYTVIDLGAANGESEAFDINESNQVVGWTFMPNGFRGAFRWENGRMELLATHRANSVALGIENDGTIVGKFGLQAARFNGRNQVVQLGTLGGQESTAYAVNERGEIAGSAQNRNAAWGAFSSTTRQAGLTYLGTLGGAWSAALDVNEVGVYAGWAHTAGPSHAAMFVKGQRPADLGTLGGPQSEAHAINDYFNITGWSDLNARHNAPNNKGNVKRAFMWTAQTRKMVAMPEPFSAGRTVLRDSLGRSYFVYPFREGERVVSRRVYGIDTFGEDVNGRANVSGYAKLYVSPNMTLERALVWISGKAYDLNTIVDGSGAEWALTHGWALSDGEWVVGRGFNYRTGTIRAFLARRTR